jgi:ADP-heptose:LPS heptosyltransferase
MVYVPNSDILYCGETNPSTTGLGDVILLTALVREVNLKYPDKKIILRLPGPKEPFYNNPRIHKIENGVCGEEHGVQTFGKTIEQIGADGYYHLDATGNKIQIGHHTATKCKWFGIDNPNITPELFITDYEKSEAEARLKTLSPDKPIILFCKNSTMPQRDWTREGWMKAIDLLKTKYEIFQIEQITRYDKETGTPKAIMETIPNARQELRGLGIREIMSLMSVTKRYLGVNTGFMPMATAFGDNNIIFADNRCAGDPTWLFPQNTHIWNVHSLEMILKIIKTKWMG